MNMIISYLDFITPRFLPKAFKDARPSGRDPPHSQTVLSGAALYTAANPGKSLIEQWRGKRHIGVDRRQTGRAPRKDAGVPKARSSSSPPQATEAEDSSAPTSGKQNGPERAKETDDPGTQERSEYLASLNPDELQITKENESAYWGSNKPVPDN